jgi:uncharacterized Tic20 family protein
MNDISPPEPPVTPPPVESSKEERTWAMVCHLAAFAGVIGVGFGHIVGPLIVWILKKDQFPLVADQGKEALNFQISLTLYLIGAWALCFVFIGFLLLPVIGIAALVLVIMAAVNANEGVAYRYPATIRFIK